MTEILEFFGLTQITIERDRYFVANLSLVVLLGIIFTVFGVIASHYPPNTYLVDYIEFFVIGLWAVFSVAVYVKTAIARSRDIGFHNDVWLLTLIPLLNIFVVIILCTKESNKNKMDSSAHLSSTKSTRFLIIGSILLFYSFIGTGCSMDSIWIMWTGLVLFLSAINLFERTKENKIQKLLRFCLLLFVWAVGFLDNTWDNHPLGAVIGLVAIVYVINKIFNFDKTILTKFPFAKWGIVSLFILFLLWLTKSIWVSSFLGFALLIFLERESVKRDGVNRVAILLALYLVEFLFLFVLAFKIDYLIAHNFGYAPHHIFFDANTYRFFADTMVNF